VAKQPFEQPMKTVQPSRGILDEYDRNARLKPALMVILPASLTIAGLGAGFSAAGGVLSGSLTAIGFTYVLAQLARDWGKRKEPQLFSAWDGKPTTAKLRHRNPAANPHTLGRYHKIASRLIGKPLPTIAEEQADPRSADLIYESVGDCLREKTRDKKTFPLIFKELVSYGFRRNLWGMKPFGVVLACVCIAVQLVILTREILIQHPIAATPVLMTLANVLLLLGWLFIVGPNWVRVPADAYGDRLLAACTAIDAVYPKKPPRKKAS
jgi:hypothetical protein